MLKKIIFSGCCMLVLYTTKAQVQTQIVGDSVYIHSNTGTGELILENSTDTIPGFLFNTGTGRTQFKRALLKLNDTTYLVGNDTLHTCPCKDSTSDSTWNYWKLTGNAETDTSNFIGTTDNHALVFKANNTFSGVITPSSSFASTALGNSALLTYSTGTLTGQPNTAFGSGALATVTSGAYNTGVGHSAGASFTTGNYNTSVGNLSDDWNQTGVNNTSIGEESMGQSGGGVHNHSYNTAIGFAALADNYGNYNIGLGNRAGQNGTGDSTLFVSDSTLHMKFHLDSTSGSAPNVIAKDVNGYWHVYQAPSPGGGGTVTSVASGYGLSGGPVTTTGTLSVDTALLHGLFVGVSDTAAMLSDYLRVFGRLPSGAIPYGNGTQSLTFDSTGLYYDGSNLNAGHSDFYSTTGLSLNGGRGYLGASGSGLTIKTNGGLPTDASKSIWFYNSDSPYVHMSMGSTSDSMLYSQNWMTIYPAYDKKFDLGKSSYRWNTLYVHKIVADSVVASDSSSYSRLEINNQSTNYTLQLSDANTLVIQTISSPSTGTVTVPPNSSVAIPVGTKILVNQNGSGQVVITPGSGVTVHSPDNALRSRTQYSLITLIKTDTNTWLASGDLTTTIANYDTTALKFIDSAGITDSATKVAINNLVIQLKDSSLWSKFLAIYPMVGGADSTTKWNLVDPRNADNAFRITWNGSPTFNTTGVLCPTTSEWGETHLKDSLLSYNNSEISYYSGTNNSTVGYDMGCSNSVYPWNIMAIYEQFSADVSTSWFDAGETTQYQPGVTKGLCTVTSTGNPVKRFDNGVLTVTYNSAPVNSHTNHTITIGKVVDDSHIGLKECRFAAIGTGLTDAQASTLYNIVLNFETALGRN